MLFRAAQVDSIRKSGGSAAALGECFPGTVGKVTRKVGRVTS